MCVGGGGGDGAKEMNPICMTLFSHNHLGHVYVTLCQWIQPMNSDEHGLLM